MRNGLAVLVTALAAFASAPPVWSLGFGEIEVDSALNQPLDAEIHLLAVKPGKRDDIEISLASPETFERFGIDRSAAVDSVRLEIVSGGDQGRMQVLLTSQKPIREPFLTLLVEARWSGQRALREYTLLLDPPVREPEATAGTDSEAGETDSTQAPPEPQQASRPPEPTSPEPEPIAESAPSPQPQPEPVTQPASSGGGNTGDNDRYGPVAANETLWSIASKVRPAADIGMNQMMLAIYQANVEDFEGNINLVEEGAMLAIPPAAEIRRIDAAAAADEVEDQMRTFAGSGSTGGSTETVSDASADTGAEAESSDQESSGQEGTQQTTTATNGGGELYLEPAEGAGPQSGGGNTAGQESAAGTSSAGNETLAALETTAAQGGEESSAESGGAGATTPAQSGDEPNPEPTGAGAAAAGGEGADANTAGASQAATGNGESAGGGSATTAESDTAAPEQSADDAAQSPANEEGVQTDTGAATADTATSQQSADTSATTSAAQSTDDSSPAPADSGSGSSGESAATDGGGSQTTTQSDAGGEPGWSGNTTAAATDGAGPAADGGNAAAGTAPGGAANAEDGTAAAGAAQGADSAAESGTSTAAGSADAGQNAPAGQPSAGQNGPQAVAGAESVIPAEGSLITPRLLLLVFAAIVLVVCIVLVLRRRQYKPVPADFSGLDAAKSEPTADEAAQARRDQVARIQPAAEAPTVEEALGDADALTDNELYDDALATLSLALEAHPDEPRLVRKRLEVHYRAGNRDAFVEEARRAYPSPDPNDADWQTVAAWGYALAPDESLFADTVESDQPEADAPEEAASFESTDEATSALGEPEDVATADATSEPGDTPEDDLGAAFADLEASAAGDTTSAHEAGAAGDAPDLPGFETETDESVVSPATGQAVPPGESDNTVEDFGLDLSNLVSETESDAGTTPAPETPLAGVEASTDPAAPGPEQPTEPEPPTEAATGSDGVPWSEFGGREPAFEAGQPPDASPVATVSDDGTTHLDEPESASGETGGEPEAKETTPDVLSVDPAEFGLDSAALEESEAARDDTVAGPDLESFDTSGLSLDDPESGETLADEPVAESTPTLAVPEDTEDAGSAGFATERGPSPAPPLDAAPEAEIEARSGDIPDPEEPAPNELIDDGGDELDLVDDETAVPDGAGTLADSEEIATKLDLARAYLDMGESEMASTLLDEVSNEGDDEQRREAANLINRI